MRCSHLEHLPTVSRRLSWRGVVPRGAIARRISRTKRDSRSRRAEERRNDARNRRRSFARPNNTGCRKKRVEMGKERMDRGWKWVEGALKRARFTLQTTRNSVNSEAPPIRHSRLKTWPISGENKKEASPRRWGRGLHKSKQVR